MSKTPKEDNRDVFEKALEAVGTVALYGGVARLVSKAGRRAQGWRKPSRKEAAKDEDAAWQRDNADKVDNMFTAYGTGVGGLTAVLGPDPRRGNFKKENRRQ